jgi:hypothetical protein
LPYFIFIDEDNLLGVLGDGNEDNSVGLAAQHGRDMYVVIASSESLNLGFLIRIPPGVSSPHQFSEQQPVSHNQHAKVETSAERTIPGSPIRPKVRMGWRNFDLRPKACR